jgi:hypothetical protein
MAWRRREIRAEIARHHDVHPARFVDGRDDMPRTHVVCLHPLSTVVTSTPPITITEVIAGPYRKNAMPLILKCYTDAIGRDVIGEWYAAQDEIIRGDFVGVIQILENVERAQYDVTMFKSLTKRAASKCVGLSEILIDRDGRHYRVLGFRGPGRFDFTMTYAFYKNEMPKYGEPCEESLRRKAEVEIDHRRSRECNFPPINEDEGAREGVAP